MALRYAPIMGVDDVEVSQQMRISSAFPAMKRVEFRRAADIDKVADDVLSYPACELYAAVGSGKSVRVPSALALRSGVTVYYVTPNPLLAHDNFRYVSKMAADNPLKYPRLEELTDQSKVRRSGACVVFSGAADLVWKLLVKDTTAVDLTNSVLFLDEAHESDAYTYVLRTLGRQFGLRTMVLASATFEPQGFRMRETLGKCNVIATDAGRGMGTWSAHDLGKPWNMAVAAGNMLFFTDSRSHAKHLRQEYSLAGAIVHSLSAKMKVEDFDLAMRDLRDKNGPIVVLIADYSFRSGFTFDVSVILDDSRVGYIDVNGITWTKKSRPAYELECEQAAGRGGRIEGTVCKYYRMTDEKHPLICDLDAVEKPAAALLFRALGFRSIADLNGTAYVDGDVPECGVKQALLGSYPLEILPPVPVGYTAKFDDVKSDGDFSSPISSPNVRAIDKRQTRNVAVDDDERLPMGKDDHVQDILDVKLDMVDNEDSAEYFDARVVGLDGLRALLDDQDQERRFTVGRFYAAGIHLSSNFKPFPSGVKSVLRVLCEDGELRASGMSRMEASAALNLLLESYNILNADLLAADRAAAEILPELNKLDFPRMRKKLIAYLEEIGKKSVERRVVAKSIAIIAHRLGLSLHILSEPTDAILSRQSEYVRAMRKDFGLDVKSAEIHQQGVWDKRMIDALSGMNVRGGNVRRVKSKHRLKIDTGEVNGAAQVEFNKWTGLNSATLQYDRGDLVAMKIQPGKLLRRLSGKSEWVYGQID